MSRFNECADNFPAGSSEQEQLSSEEIEDMLERVAVRFLIKKTKRFDYSKNPPPPRSLLAPPKKTLHECLYYLGLAPRQGHVFERKPKVQDKDSHLFEKPKLYECNICLKFFFHKRPLRKHMIQHMKQTYRCLHCNQAFVTLLPLKKHESSCRRRA